MNQILSPTAEVLKVDFFNAERPMWKLSSYGHTKEAPCILRGPGIEWSPEEARLAYITELRSTGSINNYVRTMSPISICTHTNPHSPHHLTHTRTSLSGPGIPPTDTNN